MALNRLGRKPRGELLLELDHALPVRRKLALDSVPERLQHFRVVLPCPRLQHFRATGAKGQIHAPQRKETGKKFWSTKDPGQQPFAYQAGVGQVITGWDQGLLGAQLGEHRRMNIPAKEGYGDGGFPAWGIPPGGTLDFTIEVLAINGQKGEL